MVQDLEEVAASKTGLRLRLQTCTRTQILPKDQPREVVVADHVALLAMAELPEKDCMRVLGAPVHPHGDLAAERVLKDAWKALHSRKRMWSEPGNLAPKMWQLLRARNRVVWGGNPMGKVPVLTNLARIRPGARLPGVTDLGRSNLTRSAVCWPTVAAEAISHFRRLKAARIKSEFVRSFSRPAPTPLSERVGPERAAQRSGEQPVRSTQPHGLRRPRALL